MEIQPPEGNGPYESLVVAEGMVFQMVLEDTPGSENRARGLPPGIYEVTVGTPLYLENVPSENVESKDEKVLTGYTLTVSRKRSTRGRLRLESFYAELFVDPFTQQARIASGYPPTLVNISKIEPIAEKRNHKKEIIAATAGTLVVAAGSIIVRHLYKKQKKN